MRNTRVYIWATNHDAASNRTTSQGNIIGIATKEDMMHFEFGLRKKEDGKVELENLTVEHAVLGTVKVTQEGDKVNVSVDSDNETVKSVLDFLSGSIDRFLPGLGNETPEAPGQSGETKPEDKTEPPPGRSDDDSPGRGDKPQV